MKVRKVIPHPLYNLGVAHDNDVALFQVGPCLVVLSPDILLFFTYLNLFICYVTVNFVSDISRTSTASVSTTTR